MYDAYAIESNQELKNWQCTYRKESKVWFYSGSVPARCAVGLWFGESNYSTEPERGPISIGLLNLLRTSLFYLVLVVNYALLKCVTGANL